MSFRPFFRSGRSLAIVCMLACCCVAPVPAFAQGAVAEYALKSALLFKLPQFVYRQETSADNSLGICVIGANPFGGALEKLAQRPIEGKTVRMLQLDATANPQACDFVFVSRSETGRLDAVLRRLVKPSLVTVSDIEGFARLGGMVELVTGGEGAGVSLLINRHAALRQGIEFNAQLLRLAKTVDP
jgi:hypothetical protein